MREATGRLSTVHSRGGINSLRRGPVVRRLPEKESMGKSIRVFHLSPWIGVGSSLGHCGRKVKKGGGGGGH